MGGPGDPLMTNNQPTFPEEPASLGQHRSGGGMSDNCSLLPVHPPHLGNNQSTDFHTNSQLLIYYTPIY